MEYPQLHLLDGTQIPCYPKFRAEDPVDNQMSLDTTGEYLQIGRRRPSMAPSEENADLKAQQKLFFDHAFFFLANKERILGDSRMFLAPVPVQSGLAYTGISGFRHPTLGIYLEFWLNCPQATSTNQEGKLRLVQRLSGSPLSGSNCCGVVYEDGTTECLSLPRFKDLWSTFMEINCRYDEEKAMCESYSLQQVVDILEKGAEPESCNLSEVYAAFYKREADYWQSRCISAEETCAQLRKELRRCKMNAVRQQLADLVADADRRQGEIDTIAEVIRSTRRDMLKQLHANEMTPAEYQRWWMSFPPRKEKDNATSELRHLIDDTLETLFPDDHFSMSLQEVREFLADGEE